LLATGSVYTQGKGRPEGILLIFRQGGHFGVGLRFFVKGPEVEGLRGCWSVLLSKRGPQGLFIRDSSEGNRRVR